MRLAFLTRYVLYTVLFASLSSCAGTRRRIGASATAAAERTAPSAQADMIPTGDEPAVTGKVSFTQVGDTVRIEANLRGLPPGGHGFHIHTGGDCSNIPAGSHGGHLAGEHMQHGAPTAEVHHAGDLGNLEASPDGEAHLIVESKDISLVEEGTSVVGKAVIIHERRDDLVSQPSGNAGPPIACGVIRR